MIFNRQFLRAYSLFIPLLLLSASSSSLYAVEVTRRITETRETTSDLQVGPTAQETIKKMALKAAKLGLAMAQVYAGICLLSRKSEGFFLASPINRINTTSGLAVLFAGIWTGLGVLPFR